MPKEKKDNLESGSRQMPLGQMNAEIIADTLDEEKRTVEVVFTTGERGPAYTWQFGDFYEELQVTPEAVRSARMDKGLSVCDNHATYSIRGVFGITEDYRFENGQLVGTVRFADDEESDIVFRKVATKVLKHFSLGYRRHRVLKIGEQNDLPVLSVIDWEPTELSITPVSFETNNGVRSGEQAQTFDCIIEEQNMKFGKRHVKCSPETAGTEGGQSAGGGNATPVVEGGTPAQAVEGEANRSAVEGGGAAAPVATPAPVAAPTQATRRVGDYVTVAKQAGVNIEEATRAFDENVDLNAFRTQALAFVANKSPSPGVNIDDGQRSDHQEFKLDQISSAIQARVTGNYGDLDDGARMLAQMSMIEAARHYYVSQGKRDVMGMSHRQFAGRALNASTSDFPLIFENVMNKELLAAYEETVRTFTAFARRTTVNDFREKNTYKLGDAPSLKPLGENGEYQYGSFSESKESYRIHTYAIQMGYTREMMINDDLGALQRFPNLFGPAAARLESDIVWGLILGYDFIKQQAATYNLSDGNPLFHASHNNLITPALSTDGLAALRKLGRKQRTLDNNFMNVTYDVIAVGETLETPLEQILKGVIVADEVSKTNVFRDKHTMIVEPRIEAAATANASAYYAFSSAINAIEYAHLAGNESLYTEVQNVTNVDGTAILARHDFGAGFEDFRGAAKSTGLG